MRERPRIVGIARVRDESEIIVDTIRHLESFCDGLLIYDDCSNDDTRGLIRRCSSKLLELVEGHTWSPDRPTEETRHRKLLDERARSYDPEWLFYADADERFEGPVRDLLLGEEGRGCDGVRIQLFDAYLTKTHCRPYRQGDRLADLDRMYGPERRDILMIWRNAPLFFYEGLDQREPRFRPEARILTSGLTCKHFGKGISIEQWESTCDYYARYFPEPYATKWTNRRGKAVHDGLSDFGTPLHPWPDVQRHAIITHPPPTDLPATP